MTYLEAAATVLERAGSPLHYREITRRALAERLIEPKGKTPEATMGAQLYMVVKQAESSGEPPRFRVAERGHFSLAAIQQGSLDQDIAAFCGKAGSGPSPPDSLTPDSWILIPGVSH
jgi:restriction system protein